MARRRRHEDEHMDETWLIPYSDMLTLLLALFIVMFAISQVDTQKFDAMKKALQVIFQGGVGVLDDPSAVPSEAPPLEEPVPDNSLLQEALKEADLLTDLKEKIDQYIAEHGLNNQIETGLIADGLQISIRDAALFASGKADLQPQALPLLETIAGLLQGQSNEVRIAGHTDNLPINTPEFPTNWDLSAKRSLNVMKFILNNKHLDPSRYTAVGYGEYHPKASNDSVEGRAMNRRVEICVIRKYPSYGTTPAKPAASLNVDSSLQFAKPATAPEH